jgi:hypothetical protein
MVIKGVTDSATLRNFKPRRPAIGKINKGGAKGTSTRGGWQGGDNLAYFRFTSEIPEVAQVFKAHYGDQPAEIRVYFLDDLVEDVFYTFTGMTGGGGLLLWRGDGEHVTGKRDPKTKKWQNLTGQNVAQPENFKEFGRMQCVVPELAKAGFRGIVRFNTTGRYDVRNISKELHSAFEKLGTLRQVPFLLFRVEQWIVQPDGTRRKDSLVHVCLEADYEARMVELASSEGSDETAPEEYWEEEEVLEESTPSDMPTPMPGTSPSKPPVPAKPTTGPKTLTELWGEKRWEALGYKSHKHAQNVVKKYAPGEKDVGVIWDVLVKHSPLAKETDAAERQEILDEIESDGGNREEIPQFPEEDEIPF